MRLVLASSSASAALAALLACGSAPPPQASAPPAAPATPSPSAGAEAPARPPLPAAPVATPPAPAPASAALRTLAAGASAVLRGERREHVFGDEAAFRAWLAEMTPSPSPPEIDFARELVLAVDGQDGSNTCHAVRITSVQGGARSIKARVARYSPGPQKACGMMMQRPYHAIAVPRPEGAPDVTFEWTAVTGEPAP